MSGWVYLIRNGADLYKIGRTQNLEQRMKTLKPDEIISTLETENYEQLEKKLHKKYKAVRVPQTEYFRLDDSQLSDCKSQLNNAESNGPIGPVKIITNWYDPDPRNKIKKNTKSKSVLDRFVSSIEGFLCDVTTAIVAGVIFAILLGLFIENIPILKWLLGG